MNFLSKNCFREGLLIFKEYFERPDAKSEKPKENVDKSDDVSFKDVFENARNILKVEAFSRAKEQTDFARKEMEDVYKESAIEGENNWKAIPQHIKAENKYLLVLGRELAMLRDAYYNSMLKTNSGPFNPIQKARLEQLDQEETRLLKNIYVSYSYLPKAFTGEVEQSLGIKMPYPGEKQPDVLQNHFKTLANSTDLARREFDKFREANYRNDNLQDGWKKSVDDIKATTKYAMIVARELQAMRDLYSPAPEQKSRMEWLGKEMEVLARRMESSSLVRFFDDNKTDEYLDKALESFD